VNNPPYSTIEYLTEESQIPPLAKLVPITTERSISLLFKLSSKISTLKINVD
jgi:hypothetical protein